MDPKKKDINFPSGGGGGGGGGENPPLWNSMPSKSSSTIKSQVCMTYPLV
jgi:hypothetical protein